MTDSLHYEKLIESDKISNKELIKLSELRRKVLLKGVEISTIESYYTHFLQISKKLRYNRVQLLKHPTFTWNGYTSSNWLFEKLNIENLMSSTYLNQVTELEDVKEKNRAYVNAIKYTKSALETLHSNLFVENDNMIYEVSNKRFQLSKLFNICSDRFYNAYTFKANKTAIVKAYQFKELSNAIWKQVDVNEVLTKYKAKALLQMAMQLEDDQCGERVALLQSVILNNACPEDVANQHKLWNDQNNQVYYQAVQTEIELHPISLQEAFHTLQETLESF